MKRIKKFFGHFLDIGKVNDLKPYQSILRDVHALGDSVSRKSDGDLRKSVLKKESGAVALSRHDVVHIYSIINESFKRTLEIFPYDVQILGAIALLDRAVVEMQTGEGKTVSVVFAACLNAIGGRQVHVLTHNDYLARRDAEMMKPVYNLLGITVGVIQENQTVAQKRSIYQNDVVYATMQSVGFDFLKSSMAYTPEDAYLSRLDCAIIDETDAILIDEARHPLVLSGYSNALDLDPVTVMRFTLKLTESDDYELDRISKNIFLTDSGIAKTEEYFEIENLFDTQHMQLLNAVIASLQALTLLHKDVDYVVRDNQIRIIDEFTGRIVDVRKWQNGLHSAVEAKENVPVQSVGRILNKISITSLIGHYRVISGTSGTLRKAADEFRQVFGLPVIVIPPRIAPQRVDHPDRILRVVSEKLEAIVAEVKEINKTQRPVLIGTLTVKESEDIRALLEQNGIRCEILNANNDELEATIISDAGNLGKVTVSTNMAGRGTDIKLGGADGRFKDEVASLGGLHVIGTNRHESIRIDDQLRGRAARQGDPGSSKFIISTEDDLMKRFGPSKNKLNQLYTTSVARDGGSELKMLIDHTQRVIEGKMREIRKNLSLTSAFTEQHRLAFLKKRSDVLNRSVDGVRDILKDNALLCRYDFLWAEYLANVEVLAGAIYWERLSGSDPLRRFYKDADELFRNLLTDLDELPLDGHGDGNVTPPSDVAIFVMNESPLQNQLAMKMLELGAYRF